MLMQVSRRFGVVLAILAIVAGQVRPALADPPSSASRAVQPRARAAELVADATAAYRSGDLQRAVQLLDEAYALDPQPVLLFNLGRAYEALGELDAAIDVLSRYLQAEPNAPDRGAIEQRIVTLRRQKEERIALQRQRDEERRRADEERAARARTPARPGRQRTVVPYILGGIGVTGLAVGTAFAIAATSAHEHAEARTTTQVDAVRQQDMAEAFSTVGSVSLIAGGALVAAAVTWWIASRSSSPASTVAVSPLRVMLGPGMVMMGGGLP